MEKCTCGKYHCPSCGEVIEEHLFCTVCSIQWDKHIVITPIDLDSLLTAKE